MTDPNDPRSGFRHLPVPVPVDEIVAGVETDPAPDPEGGQDPERLFLLRFGGF